MKFGGVVVSVAGSIAGVVLIDVSGVMGNHELKEIAREAAGFVDATGVRTIIADVSKVADVTTADQRLQAVSQVAAEVPTARRPRIVIVGKCAGGCGPCEATYKPLAENAGLVVDCASSTFAAKALVGL